VINPPSKVLLLGAGASAAFFTAYAWVISVDRLGIALAAGVVIAMATALWTIGVDVGPEILAGDRRPAADDRNVAPLPSVWPTVVAGAATVMLLGVTVNGWIVVLGSIALLAGSLGWLGTNWYRDRTWSPRLADRLAERITRPILIPVGAAAFVGLVAMSISRVLLAVSETSAVVVAIAVASVILVALALLSFAPRIRSTVLGILSVVAIGSLIGAGLVGASSGNREIEKEHDEVTELHIGAFGTTYVRPENHKTQVKQLTLSSSNDAELEFINYDVAIYHNVGIYKALGSVAADPTLIDVESENPLWNGKPLPGRDSGAKAKYELPHLSRGHYIFRCDFHPSMVGTLIVK
jgi:hypothetical protein